MSENLPSPPEQETVTLWRARAGCVWRLPAHEREAGRKRQQGWLSEDFVPLARLEAAEARAQKAEEALRPEMLGEALERLGADVGDRLLVFDGSPGLMAWVDPHRHHSEESHIGCPFCLPASALGAAEARARSAEEALGELRGAANEYLARQNFGGYKDGNYGHDEGCREARADLCGVLYALNAALHSSQPEEQR